MNLGWKWGAHFGSSTGLKSGKTSEVGPSRTISAVLVSLSALNPWPCPGDSTFAETEVAPTARWDRRAESALAGLVPTGLRASGRSSRTRHATACATHSVTVAGAYNRR